jgi:hypothetical protein
MIEDPYRTPVPPFMSAIDLLTVRIEALRMKIRTASWWERRRFKRVLKNVEAERADLASRARVAEMNRVLHKWARLLQNLEEMP